MEFVSQRQFTAGELIAEADALLTDTRSLRGQVEEQSARTRSLRAEVEEQSVRIGSIETLSTLDDKIAKVLEAGHIRLLCAAWLRERPTGWKMMRRQDLELLEQRGERPFLSAEEAVAAIHAADRRIAVLSYGWLSVRDPDPQLHRINAVRRCLATQTSLVGLFWDFGSLPQRPRTAAEDVSFKAALKSMCDLYASAVGTCVLQLQQIPPMPAELRGVIEVHGVPPSVDEAAIRASLAPSVPEGGEIRRSELQGDGVACVAMSDDAVARCVVSRLNGGDTPLAAWPGAFAALAYNDLPFTRRGWCVMEDAATTEVLAHLSYYADWLQHALQSLRRPKALLITADAPPEQLAVPYCAAGLQARVATIIKRIESAHFIGNADRSTVVRMYAEYGVLMFNRIKDVGEVQGLRSTEDRVISFEGARNARGNATGQVVIQYSSGSRYEGEALDGLFHGDGEFTWPVGNIFRGEFLDGNCHRGKMTYRTGGVQEGQWSSALADTPSEHPVLHGRGKHTLPNGVTYEGEWVKGVKEGHGTLSDPNAGLVYAGQFRADLRHGRGVFTAADGEVYDGEWHEGVKQGDGRLLIGGRTVYEGQFVAGHIEGWGVLTEEDGDSYEGQFVQGEREGRGTYTARTTGHVLAGSWRAGQFLG